MWEQLRNIHKNTSQTSSVFEVSLQRKTYQHKHLQMYLLDKIPNTLKMCEPSIRGTPGLGIHRVKIWLELKQICSLFKGY